MKALPLFFILSLTISFANNYSASHHILECDGCPPVGIKVKIHLSNESMLEGYISLQAPAMAPFLDKHNFQEIAKHPAHKNDIPDSLNLWTRATFDDTEYYGYQFIQRRFDQPPDSVKELTFSLPEKSIILLGQPKKVPKNEIVRIERLSENYFPVFFISEVEEEYWGQSPKTAVVIKDNLEVDATIYCFSYEEIAPSELAKICYTYSKARKTKPSNIIRLYYHFGT